MDSKGHSEFNPWKFVFIFWAFCFVVVFVINHKSELSVFPEKSPNTERATAIKTNASLAMFSKKLDRLALVSNDTDYNLLLSDFIKDIKEHNLEKNFFNYYRDYQERPTSLLEVCFLNKVLVSLDGALPLIKKILSDDAYLKNNAFKVYDIHGKDRPSEIFNMGRTQLIELLMAQSDFDQLEKIESELVSLIKTERDLSLVRHALKAWIAITGNSPDKSWFYQRQEGEIAKLSDLI